MKNIKVILTLLLSTVLTFGSVFSQQGNYQNEWIKLIAEVNELTKEIEYISVSHDPNDDPFLFSDDSLKILPDKRVDSTMIAVYSKVTYDSQSEPGLAEVIDITVQEIPIKHLREVNGSEGKLTLTFREEHTVDGKPYYIHIIAYDTVHSRLIQKVQKLLDKIRSE